MSKIAVIGGGLVGSLLSVFLARKGFEVSVFDKRTDIRKAKIVAGRSINLVVADRGWKALEKQLGSECSLNIASHALAVADESEENEFAIFSRLSRYQNLLWPRGSSIRGTELNYFNMFQAENRHTERLMVEVLFKEHIPQINIEDDSWLERLHEVLKASGNADLRVERNNLTQIIKIITTINLEQIDHLGLLLHPRIGGVKWDKGSLLVRVELAESLQ